MEDKILKDLADKSGINYSELVIAKDNVLEALVINVNRLIEYYGKSETCTENINLFKDMLVTLVKLGQDAGALQLLVESMEGSVNE